jgi:transposase-like protein
MGNVTKRQHTADFKIKVALEAIKQTKTVAQIANEYGVHPTQIKRWKQSVEEGLIGVFSDNSGRALKDKDELIDKLYHQIGKLQVQVDWLKKKMGLNE